LEILPAGSSQLPLLDWFRIPGEIIAKRLDLVLELVPSAVAVGALVNLANPNSKADTNAILQAAQKRSRQIVVVNANADNDVDAAFADLVDQRVEGCWSNRILS